ncbi:replication initiator protein A [Cetobacterium somerae]|uniref:replication initiator protein A n=1 Tax=Cetobacterium somerae TaxID=188913 RepID=UPI00248EEC5B|nr:replication initiator protein A [Cetobacterium somerae]
MSRMKIKDFKKLEFYQLPKWLLNVNGLKPVDIVIYTLAFNNWKLSVKNNLVNENDEIYFFMTHEGIREEIEIGKDQVIDSIKRLVKSKVIIQEKVKGKATRFYLEDDLNQIQFKETKKLESSRKNSTTKNPTSVVGKSNYTSTENPTTSQSENTDINKTNLLNKTKLIKTTTKLNYIYPIDNPNKKNNSSFILDDSKELKKYLIDNIQDIPTCKNIMFLVENIGLSLERIKEVVNYATKSQKGIGFIYKALEENWTLKDITYSIEKNISTTPTARGHKFNSEAIDSTIEAKEAKEEYTAKIDRLQGIYQVLSDTEKKKIDDEAYQLAVEQYGPTVAKIMARTKTKFEILEKYYLLEEGA